MPSHGPFTSPTLRSAASSTELPASKRSSSPTFTTAKCFRLGALKPNFGNRRWSGLWPPSKPSKCMLPVRAFWPLPPRPAVLPRPEPWPRPTRFLRWREFLGDRSWWRLNMVPRSVLTLCSPGASEIPKGDLARLAPLSRPRLLVANFLTDEVLDLEHHAANGRRVGQNAHLPHFPKTQAANGAPLGIRGASKALDQLHLEGHRLTLHPGRFGFRLFQLQLAAAKAGHLIGRPQVPQSVHRRLEHVVWISRTLALGEDVSDSCRFEHRADRAAGDHAGPLHRRLEQNPSGAKVADHVVGNRVPKQRHLE